MMAPTRLLRNVFALGGLTLISRVLGMIRDIMIAAIFAGGPVADTFLAAFRLPNLFRRLFAEGAFSAAFIPLFTRAQHADGDRAAMAFADRCISALLTLLIPLIVVTIIAMPWLMPILVPGYDNDPAKAELAIRYGRILFPYLLPISLVMVLAAILNSFNRFVMVGLVPIVLNLFFIATLILILLAEPLPARGGVWLCWGILAAGSAQLILVFAAARRHGIRLKLPRPRLTPDVRRLWVLGVPGLIAGGAMQINMVVTTILASWHDGAVAWLYYAERLYQLPLGMIGLALATVLLPAIARAISSGNDKQARLLLNQSLLWGLLIALPATAGLILLANPLVTLIFHHGAFSATDSLAVASAARAFATGLPAFIAIKILSPAFFAREDTRTPMLFALANVAATIILALALFPTYGHVAIAAATSIAAWGHVGLIAGTLYYRKAFTPDHDFMQRLGRIIIATILMSAGLSLILALFLPRDGLALFPLRGDLALGAFVIAVMIAACVGYAALVLGLKVIRLAEVTRLMRRQQPVTPADPREDEKP